MIEPDRYNRVEVCELLAAEGPDHPEVAAVNSNKQFFQYVNMGPIKLVISFQLEKKELNLDPRMSF